MIVGALLLMALFLAGTIYVWLKLRQDRKTGNSRMVALGSAAFAGYLVMLSMGAHLILVALGV